MNKTRRKANVKFTTDYKQKKGCEICKTKKELTFHHINPNEKTLSICKLARNTYNMEVIKKEISKCQVLCKECHKKIHKEIKL